MHVVIVIMGCIIMKDFALLHRPSFYPCTRKIWDQAVWLGNALWVPHWVSTWELMIYRNLGNCSESYAHHVIVRLEINIAIVACLKNYLEDSLEHVQQQNHTIIYILDYKNHLNALLGCLQSHSERTTQNNFLSFYHSHVETHQVLKEHYSTRQLGLRFCRYMGRSHSRILSSPFV